MREKLRGGVTLQATQMSTDPLLSICIATFNRARFLGATLDSILPQCGDGVEVIIVDGGSTDPTPTIAAEYQSRHPTLRYERLPGNGGVDHDFNVAVGLARGTWCWLFPDDDIMLLGAIDAVLSRIDEGHDLILVNAEVRDVRLGKILDANRLGLQHDRVYASSEQASLFTDCGNYLTFIGCVVIRRALWESRDRERYFGTLFIHFGVVFQSPLTRTALALADPHIAIRYGNAMWTSRGFEIWMFKWPELVWSMPFPEIAKAQVVAREPWRSPLRLMLFRAMGAYSRAEYRSLIAPRLNARLRDLPAQMIAAVIAVFPGVIANALAFAVAAVLTRFRRTTTWIDLRNSRFCLFNLWDKGRRGRE
jgi:abequosyltransferase